MSKIANGETMRNFSLENLVKQLEEKREAEKKEYYDNLAKKAIHEQMQDQANKDHDNPLETIFTLNL